MKSLHLSLSAADLDRLRFAAGHLSEERRQLVDAVRESTEPGGTGPDRAELRARTRQIRPYTGFHG